MLMAKITIETPDGVKAEFVYSDGFTWPSSIIKVLPYGEDYGRHVCEVQHLTVRDDDLFVATYSKCGTHWAWEIVTMLQRGSADYAKAKQTRLFLDVRTASFIDGIPSPRVLNTHFPRKLCPMGLFDKKIKIVHVMRNPKDMMVSLYYHLKAMCKDDEFVKDFKTFLPFALGEHGLGTCVYLPYFEYLKQWEDFTEAYPDQILNLYFEDMKEDPIKEIKKIDEFLETNRNDDLIKKIAEACDFVKLKNAEAEIKEDETGKLKGRSFIYRKGDVGDWMNHFTVRMNEKMDKWIDDNSGNTKFKFRYTI